MDDKLAKIQKEKKAIAELEEKKKDTNAKIKALKSFLIFVPFFALNFNEKCEKTVDIC